MFNEISCGACVASGNGQSFASPGCGLSRNTYSFLGRDSGAFRVKGGEDSREHRYAAKRQTDPSDRYLPLPRPSRVEGGVSGFPLRAKVGLALIIPLFAAGVWGLGCFRFWGDRSGLGELLAHGALASGLIALSAAFWGWAMS